MYNQDINVSFIQLHFPHNPTDGLDVASNSNEERKKIVAARSIWFTQPSIDGVGVPCEKLGLNFSISNDKSHGRHGRSAGMRLT